MTINWESLSWLAAVPQYDLRTDGTLEVVTSLETDFWRETQYGFVKDDGHAFLRPAPREFTLTVTLCADFEHLYDHAGLMLRVSETEWIKFGVEFVGVAQWSAVVTHGQSDWNVQPAPDVPNYTFRIIRRGDAVIMHARDAASTRWVLQRVAYLNPALETQVGVLACSPKREGFHVVFRDLALEAPDLRPLHDLVGN